MIKENDIFTLYNSGKIFRRTKNNSKMDVIWIEPGFISGKHEWSLKVVHDEMKDQQMQLYIGINRGKIGQDGFIL